MQVDVVELKWNEDIDHLSSMLELELLFGADGFDEKTLTASLQSSTNIVAVLVDGELACYTATETSEDGSEYIWQLVTAPEHRGRGYATRALYTLIDKGQPLSLHVREDNEAALGLYLDLGFRICSTRPNMYADGTNGLFLTKTA